MAERKAHVLIIDDDPALRELTREVLELEGYSALAAPNATLALELLRKGHSPCLILLDLRMPGMDGMEFLEAFRRLSSADRTRLVVVSADRDATRLFAPLGIECLLKPVDLGLLLSVVRRHC
jgi:CheY-like chemotaxis protein